MGLKASSRREMDLPRISHGQSWSKMEPYIQDMNPGTPGTPGTPLRVTLVSFSGQSPQSKSGSARLQRLWLAMSSSGLAQVVTLDGGSAAFSAGHSECPAIV